MSQVPYRMIGVRIGKFVRGFLMGLLMIIAALGVMVGASAAIFSAWGMVNAVISLAWPQALNVFIICLAMTGTMGGMSWLYGSMLWEMIEELRRPSTSYHIPITPSRHP